MQTRVLRFLLLAVLVAAGSGGVYWTWTLARHVVALENAGRQTATRIDRIEALLDDLNRDDFRYTTGQLDHTAVVSANGQLQHVSSDSAALLEQMLAKPATAASTLAEATASIAESHAQARQNLDSGIDETAAAFVFTGTRRERQVVRDQLRQLRAAESTAVAETRAKDLQQAWLVLGTVALLFAAALVQSARRLPVHDAPPRTSEASVFPVEQQPAASAPAVDLGEAAALSNAIARMQSEAALPVLLERMASLVGAPGIVIWMTAGEELFPVAGHGYDARQWMRLGPVGRSSPNATAAAWRTGTLQVVGGAPTDRAAIAAPMLVGDRCVGVVAVEIPSGRETDHATQVLVTVIAAQLGASIVAWPDASTATEIDALSFERMSASSG